MHRAVVTESFRANSEGLQESTEGRLLQTLERVERNLNDLMQGLSLVGVKRCSQCGKFFRASDPGALFADKAAFICFECIPVWWHSRREQLSCADRQKTEVDLVYWLRGYHNARSFAGSSKPEEGEPAKFEFVANCLECRGTGKYLGEKRCRYCTGPGTILIVVPQRTR